MKVRRRLWAAVVAVFSAHTSGHDLGSDTGLEEGPILRLRISHPTDGDVETLPVVFRVDIKVESMGEFTAFAQDKRLCIELNEQREECRPLTKASIGFDDLPIGSYSARAFVLDGRGSVRYHTSATMLVSIVSDAQFDAYSAVMTELSTKTLEYQGGRQILEWAAQQQVLGRFGLYTSHGISEANDTFLVIGVKTESVGNFERRQAIRQTWASVNALPHNVTVIFVGCAPNLTNVQSLVERQMLEDAIDMEKRTYGDLIVDELRCGDSKLDLSNKVKQFLRFGTENFPQAKFIMLADDDIYLRADRLVAELRKENSTSRVYIGQKWDGVSGKSALQEAADREKRYANFALSMDCARFIAKNSHRFEGFGSRDDTSVALWLLPSQVHVTDSLAFSSLATGKCQNKLLALGDLSPLGILSVHSNLINNLALCNGFDEERWQISTTITDTSPLRPLWSVDTYVSSLEDTQYLYITSIVSTEYNAGVKVSYYPSVEIFQAYSSRACLEARVLEGIAYSKSWMCRELTQNLRFQAQQQLQRLGSTGTIGPAFLELVRYNIFTAEKVSPVIVAYTAESSYASVVFECIFKTIFEHSKRPVLVVPEKALRESYNYNPDIFIFSIFDTDCEPMSKPGCQEMITYYSQYERISKIMMISGEAIDTEALDDRIPLLSSVSSVTRERHVYLPVASISFAERLQNSPLDLLSPATADPFDRRFCAYLYARCDRPYREDMYDLLNAMEPVDALGVCAGSSRPPDISYKPSRYAKWFNDEAVATYRRYKFVVAFENSGVPGYVTEKLANPFLAGSIPIYLGNSTTVSELFNPESFIDCGRFEKLQDCALFVMKVHESRELYERMRREPPITNVTAFNDIFSWHPSVPSRALADKVAKMLEIRV